MVSLLRRSPQAKKGPAGPGASAPPRPRSEWVEPPAFRPHPARAPGACINCSGPLPARGTMPLCWGCGRPLCVDCYWRHGLEPTAHRCASCRSSGTEGSLSVSGGRSAARELAGPAPP